MKRADRRRFESEFKSILKKTGDNCSLCKAPLQHNVRTFGGLTEDNKTALTSECCKEKLAAILQEGVYITKNMDSIPNFSSQSHMQMNVANPSKAIGLIQSHFESLDSLSSDLLARAGVTSTRHEVSITDTPWKLDDAAWFEANPNRYHRLRKALKGELDSIPKNITEVNVPQGYRLDIVIRQISPGQRARLPVWLNSAVVVPDVEAIANAIFDVASAKERGALVPLDEILKRAVSNQPLSSLN